MAWPDQKTDLHVLMTADAVGGVWQYALDLSEGLRAHGVTTTIAVLGPSPSADQQAIAETTGAKLILTGLPLDWTARSRHEVEEAFSIRGRANWVIEPRHISVPESAKHIRALLPIAEKWEEH